MSECYGIFSENAKFYIFAYICFSWLPCSCWNWSIKSYWKFIKWNWEFASHNSDPNFKKNLQFYDSKFKKIMSVGSISHAPEVGHIFVCSCK